MGVVMTRGTYLKAAVVVAVLVLGIAGTYFLAGGLGEQGRPGEPLTVAQLEAWIDEYSNWGRWGEDDDLGAIQLITPEKRVQAAALVRDGVTVSLAELQIPNVDEPGRPTPYRFEFTFRENYEEYVMSNPWTAPPAERLTVVIDAAGNVAYSQQNPILEARDHSDVLAAIQGS